MDLDARQTVPRREFRELALAIVLLVLLAISVI
jgi:hypothetical protein